MNQQADSAPQYTSNLVPTASATAMAQLLNSPLAIQATPQQLEYTLAQAMAKAFADMGINTTDRNDEITYLVQNMPAEVLRTLPNIRLSEIPVAINRGILRQFGNFFGLNVATFMHFLMAHYQSEQRLNAIKAHSAALASQAPKPVPSAQQIKQNRISRIATAFYQYKTTGYYNDYGSLVFDNINAMGKIPFTPSKKPAYCSKPAKT
ncbi:hypothetical protein BDD43_5139 [Mucilaginibacter gracilis]|uniref:Uncharacterized protein n=1 Tax=Mucilaginibacter gracilis TaxID=423350 RepID=A0A495J7A8_9SPHI|nr:hypothetical protein [Mucilaginibacter gracilis]RKR84886.1 hypothetical protein BDD43_5139 [Mucilaginibacter gracilis]